MNKQEESFMEILEGYKKGEWTLAEAIGILSKIEDETLQEQAKEIKEELEKLSFVNGYIKIIAPFHKWDNFWEKYCPKEEEKK